MKKIRWGILGVASIAGTVAPAIQASRNGRLAAVASRSLGKAQAFAREMQIPKVFDSYDALIESGTVDAVYIPLPNTLHVPWTLRCLKAGLPVLCEKPMALSRFDAALVAQAAQETGLAVAEAFMYRYHPVYHRLNESLTKGVIGDITSMEAAFTFFEDSSTSIVRSSELGGGALTDVGCYCIDFFHQVMGMGPRTVRALSVGRWVDESMVGVLEYESQVLARFEASIGSTERHVAVVHGTKGSLEIQNPWIPGPGGVSLVLRRHRRRPVLHRFPDVNCYQLQVEDFADACLGRSPLRFPLSRALDNAQTIERLHREAQRD
jgi:predicted dehydrogenase